MFRFAVFAARALVRAALTAALAPVSTASLSSAPLSSSARPALDGARR
jgi:hypothetical protein